MCLCRRFGCTVCRCRLACVCRVMCQKRTQASQTQPGWRVRSKNAQILSPRSLIWGFGPGDRGLDFGPCRGWVCAGALESDSRGACAPLDASFTGYRNGISHQGVLHCTNNRHDPLRTPRSASSPHHTSDTRTFIPAALAHRSVARGHEQSTAVRARTTTRHRTWHGGFSAWGHQQPGRGVLRPRSDPARTQRLRASLPHAPGSTGPCGRP